MRADGLEVIDASGFVASVLLLALAVLAFEAARWLWSRR